MSGLFFLLNDSINSAVSISARASSNRVGFKHEIKETLRHDLE